jgi:hypothetical protein
MFSTAESAREASGKCKNTKLMQEKDVDIIAAERTVTIINIYTYKIT